MVLNAVRVYGPDDLGTRVCLRFQEQFLDDALPDDGYFGMGRKGNGSGEGMEVFYKTDELAPIDTANFWLSKRPEISGSRDCGAPNIRMVTWAKLHPMKSRRFFCYLNTHFDKKVQ